MGIDSPEPVILGDWKDKQIEPIDSAVIYERTRQYIKAALTDNGLLIKVDVDDHGKDKYIEIGRFLAVDIYKMGMSKEHTDELLREFLPRQEVKAKESIYGANAAKRLGGEVLFGMPGITKNSNESYSSRPLDFRELAAGEARDRQLDD